MKNGIFSTRKMFISTWEIHKVLAFKFNGPNKENVKISLDSEGGFVWMSSQYHVIYYSSIWKHVSHRC